MDDPLVKIDILYGHIDVQTRMVPIANGLAGEDRRRTYDRDGNCTEDTGWHRTGCNLIWPEPECRRWWEFWK